MASRSQNNYVKELASVVGVIATLSGNGAVVNTFWCCSIQAKNGCIATPAKLAVDEESWKNLSGNRAVADCPLCNYWLDAFFFAIFTLMEILDTLRRFQIRSRGIIYPHPIPKALFVVVVV